MTAGPGWSRRRWLRTAVALPAAGALTVLLPACRTLPVFPGRPLPDADAALGWISHRDGRYRLWLPRAEMGQHIDTALLQLAAEELGVAPETIAWARPSTAELAPLRATVGSESLMLFGPPLAQACAELREALQRGEPPGLRQAAPRPLQELRAYAALARGDGRWAGRPLRHPLLPALLTGRPTFAADQRLPGVVYGRVLRAPASPDLPSQARSWNETAARAVPGFIGLVQQPLLQHGQAQGLGLLAATPGALDRAAQALAPDWQVDGRFEAGDLAAALDVDTALAGGALPHSLRQQGDAGDASAQAGGWDVDLRLDIGAAPHAGIEPRCALAAFDAQGGLDVWTGSQDPFYVRAVLARRLGLDPDTVRVHNQRIGGAFGACTLCTVELEAALLARAAGRPVKLQWTRADEWQQGFHRPPSSHRLRARLQGGRIVAWWHAFVSTPILLTNAALPPWLNPVTRLIGDGGTARGAALPYAVPAQRIEYALRRLPLYCGPWRGLGAGPNALAVESAIDDCARAAGADALQFRLDHAPPPRLARVLREVAAAAGWSAPPAPGRHRGLACGIYKEHSFAAVVAEVESVPAGEGAAAPRRWRVARLVCAIDAGRLVHPDAVRAQTEGNLVWGLGMVFGAALPLRAGGIAAQGLVEAGLPRLSQLPQIEVRLVQGDEAPGGAGETAIVAAAAAIANALRQASGQRPRRFPLDDDDPARHAKA
ncbi:MAG: molybdopterin-dependent oxidoreductase [Burkholderiaceae bacterium]|nr:molybdopterin-dependent oxidoreductase [Burkholderiaceae bacterium]